MNYTIAIPSRARADKITNGKFYPLFKNTCALNYFVRQEELRAYEGEGLKVTPVPDYFNIAQKRHLMLQLAIAKGYEYLFIADDDIIFGVRRDDDIKKFRQMEESDVKDFLNLHMRICGREHPIVHPILRMHGDKKKYMYEKNCPAIRFVCYHVPTFQSEAIRIDGLGTVFMSDRYAQLSMLDRGYTSIALAKYTVDDNGTNAKGGCSEYRTPELQSEAAKKLSEAFPTNVSLRWKHNGQWDERRLDCTIQWKKFLSKDELPYIPKEDV